MNAAPRDHPSSEETDVLVALFTAGRYAEAAGLARAMTVNFPRSAFGWKALGATLRQMGRSGDALSPAQMAVALSPEDAEAHDNLGIAFKDLGQLEAAVASYRRALELKPDFADAHNRLGIALKDLGQLEGAVASYRRALAIKPDFANAHNNLGNLLKGLGKPDEAVASYRRALEIKPDSPEMHCNLGAALRELGQLDDAVASYRRALALKPDLVEAHSNLLFVHNYQPEQPAAMVVDEARRFGDLVARQARPAQDWRNVRQPGRCLRVGMVSGDLRAHPVGYFLESVLAALGSRANDRLEFFAYPNYSRSDAVTERIKRLCRGWQPAVGLSDERLARRIRDDGIDILLDLSGHTAHNRLPMFAWKPAPVQASWIGYLGTTGVAAMDYLIADPWTLPESEAPNYTEKIWRLPESYLCFTRPDGDLQVSAAPAMANGYITFGCFNNLTKMNDDVVARWARILQAVPGSRLFLKTAQLSQKTSRGSVNQRFASHGIDAGRLILEGPAPRVELLSSYGRVDVALDPFPYPGITTSVEALWMGVPVLTMAGDRFLSRQGVGINTNAGLPEWIATDADDYVARAVAHAGDLVRLATLRTGLRQTVMASPLFDAPRFARHFEAALRGMWTKWCESRSDD